MPVPGGTTRKFSKAPWPHFKKVVALAVALVLELDVPGKRLRRAELIDDHGMVDDEIDGHQRIDLVGVALEVLHAVAHGREIDDGGNAGEILHQDACRAEADLFLRLALVLEPFGHRRDVGLGDGAAVLVAQKVLEQHLHGIREPRNAFQAVGLGIGKRKVDVALSSGGKSLHALEAVYGNGSKRRSRSNLLMKVVFDRELRRRSAGGSKRAVKRALGPGSAHSLLR